MGPVLQLRTSTTVNEQTTWLISAIAVVDDDMASDLSLMWGVSEAVDRTSRGTLLISHRGKSVIRFDMNVILASTPQHVSYQVPGFNVFNFTVPARGAIPNSVFASCNGFSSLSEMKKTNDNNRLWRRLLIDHREQPYHLLLMGGDQVYADSLWETVPEVLQWQEKNKADMRTADFAPMHERVRDFYFDLYCSRWSQPELAEAFSSIPTVMMWDDHDIFDGWGSYPKEMQDCPVYTGIYSEARRHFRVFQQHCVPEEPHPSATSSGDGLSLFLDLGQISILALDLRSERTRRQVIGEPNWRHIRAQLNTVNLGNSRRTKHLLVMSSIPVVHPSFSWFDNLIGFVPKFSEMEDDLKDHWHSPDHKAERKALIHWLLEVGSRDCRVTILSGDVHVGGAGVIESSRSSKSPNGQVINQLTSSGIVHPGPPVSMLAFLEMIGLRTEEVDRGVDARMMCITGHLTRFIGARNFLTIRGDGNSCLWARWFVEDEDQEYREGGFVRNDYSKVIHPASCAG